MSVGQIDETWEKSFENLHGLLREGSAPRVRSARVEQRYYPGIVFRGHAHDRRAALAGGRDVWEVVGRLQELHGAEEQRISLLAEESGMHSRLVRLALDYAAEYPDDILARIERNRAMAERIRAASQQREALLRDRRG